MFVSCKRCWFLVISICGIVSDPLFLLLLYLLFLELSLVFKFIFMVEIVVSQLCSLPIELPHDHELWALSILFEVSIHLLIPLVFDFLVCAFCADAWTQDWHFEIDRVILTCLNVSYSQLQTWINLHWSSCFHYKVFL